MDNFVDPFLDTPEFLKYVGVGVVVKDFYTLKQGHSFHLYEADDWYKEKYYRVRCLYGKWEDGGGDRIPEKDSGGACWIKEHFTLTTSTKPIDPFKDTPTETPLLFSDKVLDEENVC